jgi:hypothetical protein
MESDSSTIDIINNDGEENRNYVRNQSDHQLPTLNQEERGHIKRLPRTGSVATASFPIICEVPTDAAVTEVTLVPPPSTSSASFTQQQQHRRSTGTGPFDRQLSILDPMSDRVSTILVWQNLVVSTREDKKKQFIQSLTSKNPQPKTKRLLHNVSGAITGGLWAVMGKFYLFHIYQR